MNSQQWHNPTKSYRSGEQSLRPAGGKGSNCYRYVIAFEGTNTIHGCRQGGLKAVTRAVEEIVAQLNERQHLGHSTKPRRVQLVLNKKPRKANSGFWNIWS